MSAHIEDGQAQVDHLHFEHLAALHAVFRGEVNNWRQDVLLSAAVFILARRELTIEELSDALNKTWATNTITNASMRSILIQGEALQLVVRHPTVKGIEKWSATPGALRDADADEQWAQQAIDNFQKQVSQRLSDYDIDLNTDRLLRVSTQLMQSLAIGAASDHATNVDNFLGHLRPLKFDIHTARQWIKDNVQPKSVREGCEQLLIGAINPRDDFGNEIVHLLVTGNVLRSIMTRQDIPNPVQLTDTRLLLDTSVLMCLADENSTERAQLLMVIEQTQMLGGSVVVAEHTLDEWEGVWNAAELEDPDSRIKGSDIPEHFEDLVANLFTKYYIRHKSKNPSTTWIGFQGSRRDLRSTLAQLNVNVRPHGNSKPHDVELQDNATVALIDQLKPSGLPARSRNAAEADAASLTMIARWRRNNSYPPTAGFFCARDLITGKIYRDLVPLDPVPLTVSPEVWLTFMAKFGAGGVDDKQQVSELIGSNLIRDSFFGLASSYTLEEAIHISNILVQDNKFDPEDLSVIIQMELAELVPTEDQDRTRALAEEAIRRRGERRDSRSRQRLMQAEERDREARQKLDKAEQHDRKLQSHIEEVRREEQEQHRRDISDRELRYTSKMRQALTAVFALLYSLAVAGIWMATGSPSGRSIGIYSIGAAIVVLFGLDASLHPEKTKTQIILGACLAAASIVIGFIL